MATDQKIYVNVNGDTLTIREGKAQDPLPLREPLIVNVSGDIHTVSNYLSGRTTGFSSQAVDKNKALVFVSKKARSIRLLLDPENHYGAKVEGVLELSDELKQFRINEGTTYGRKELLKLIKFSRLYFDNKEEHQKLVEGLMKVRMKTTTELEQENDSRGNKKNLHEVKLIEDGGMATNFTLYLPIFKGFPAQKITVEICFEVVNNEVSFWLESVGLKEAIDSSIDAIFESELKACAGFVIINQ